MGPFIAEVEGDEVRVIAQRTFHAPGLAAALRDGLPAKFAVEAEWIAARSAQEKP
jgi:hypothetical protein